MTDSSALGDRMKRHEAAYRSVLPRRTYTVCRVDIRAAHSLLRDAERPFDAQFAADMDATAEALCEEITGAVFAYTQSDEISVLYTDFASIGTEPWFGGVVAKQVSIAAAVATAELNARRPGKRALFDARVFTLSDPVEVANYFLWRQRDAVRNSISMAAQARFSHRELHGVNTGRMQEKLWAEHGINWNDYPDGFKRGRVTVKQVGERDVEYVDKRTKQAMRTTAIRTWWETAGAPRFTTEAGSWLGEVIPQLPQLKGALDGPAEQSDELTVLEARLRGRLATVGMTLVISDPIEQLAAEPATLDRFLASFPPGSEHGLSVYPFIPDESLPPGEVHLRPRPRPADLPADDRESLPADFAGLPCGGWCLGDCPGCCACGTGGCSGCKWGRELDESG